MKCKRCECVDGRIYSTVGTGTTAWHCTCSCHQEREETVEDKELDLEEMKIRRDKASKVVSELCLQERDWIMSIPARPDVDPDLIISTSLHDIIDLIKEVERLRGVCRERQQEAQSFYDEVKWQKSRCRQLEEKLHGYKDQTKENAKLLEEVEKLHRLLYHEDHT